MRRIFFFIIFTLFASSVMVHGQIKLDYDSQRPGGDYSNFTTSDVRECSRKCEISSRCQAFDYYNSDKSCWLKDKIYQARVYQGVVSGAKKFNKPKKSGTFTGDLELNFDTQRPGGDYTSFRAQSLQQCSDRCARDPHCAAFDFTTSDYLCYLKSWTPPSRSYIGIVSGVKKKLARLQKQIPDPVKPVKPVQRMLIQKGYNPGPADGIMGKKTAIALKDFQNDQALPVTGAIDNATLIALEIIHSPSSKPTAIPPVPSSHPQIINVAIFPWILDDEASSFKDFLKETIAYHLEASDKLRLTKSYYKIKKIPQLNVSGSSKFYGWNRPDTSQFIDTYNQPNIPLIQQIGKEQDIQLAIIGAMAVHCRWSDNCQVRQIEVLLIDTATGQITSGKGSSWDMDARDYIDSEIVKVLKKYLQ
ncbi:MAG: peptidoglycan-binding protein [Deltaproteobacteria bacterium]|nr:peptidoglycan-binding protein [Deltaproteobacteria bacterium]MBW2659469.1 peptidoglycan-binding protein [Deltaproteobacteria bacterium]